MNILIIFSVTHSQKLNQTFIRKHAQLNYSRIAKERIPSLELFNQIDISGILLSPPQRKPAKGFMIKVFTQHKCRSVQCCFGIWTKQLAFNKTKSLIIQGQKVIRLKFLNKEEIKLQAFQTGNKSTNYS